MTKVITYGTYDLLHYGHIKLLERAKALGDYLIVGVTGDDFDRTRGKINVHQTLMERIEAIRATGLADEIIVEEYEGQKIDDIKRYQADIFTVGSDWVGVFDYLNEYCKVVYLERTQGVSSTEIRAAQKELRVGIVGESKVINKYASESALVNGIQLVGVCTRARQNLSEQMAMLPIITESYELLLEHVDAMFILSHPSKHYEHVKMALLKGVHVLCESPISLREDQCKELYAIAKEKKCILSEGIKTAYSTAYNRMILLAKSGKIGDIVSIAATCTSLSNVDYANSSLMEQTWNSMFGWGPTVLLPMFQLLGFNYRSKHIISRMGCEAFQYDEFTQMNFIYPSAIATLRVGKGIKSEGHLIIAGTKGYIYVPAPWWKTEYFEIRYENPADNKRYFYQLDGEGIRYEILSFIRAVEGNQHLYISPHISENIAKIMQAFSEKDDFIDINSHV